MGWEWASNVSDIISLQIMITITFSKYENYFERPTIQRVHPINQTITAMKLQSNFIISITKEAERRYFKNRKMSYRYKTNLEQQFTNIDTIINLTLIDDKSVWIWFNHGIMENLLKAKPRYITRKSYISGKTRHSQTKNTNHTHSFSETG